MALHCSCKPIKTLRSDIIKSGTCSSKVSHVFDLVLATMKAQAHRLRYSSSCSNAVHQRRSITSQLQSNPNARVFAFHPFLYTAFLLDLAEVAERGQTFHLGFTAVELNRLHCLSDCQFPVFRHHALSPVSLKLVLCQQVLDSSAPTVPATTIIDFVASRPE